jgi:hypothetical protein
MHTRPVGSTKNQQPEKPRVISNPREQIEEAYEIRKIGTVPVGY